MTSYSKHYEKNLYPLQTGVLNIIKNCNTHFYLTGGTALSRGYYNHRYSDDLDFFINNDDTFQQQVSIVLKALKKAGYVWDTEKDYFLTESFCSIKLLEKQTNTLLKIDFVNDIPEHFGDFVATNIYYKTDSVRNILSNKISALFRYEAKDVADIREIALHEHFNWADIICEARQKDAGIEIPVITEIIKDMPENEFRYIKWIKNPEWDKFKTDMEIIISDMLTNADNNLVRETIV